MRIDAVDAAWTLDQCGSVTQTGVALLDQCDEADQILWSSFQGFPRCTTHTITNMSAPNLPAVHSYPSAKWSKDWGMWVVWHGK